MAWPCISRVCCLARFWNQFDKSDLSVPLTIQNYSDITEHREVRSVTKQVSAQDPSPPRSSSAAPLDARAQRGSCRREPTPREDHQPPGAPFSSVTQYKQDYKPWPLPRKDNFPWISNKTSAEGPQRGAKDERVLGPHQGAEPSPITSYREEYRSWTGVKPAKSSKKKLPVQPGTQASYVVPETSYQAAYSGDTHMSAALDHNSVTASSNAGLQTAPGHPASICSPPSSQHSIVPEGEEHLVRNKLPPNPTAIFQSGSRNFRN